MSNTVTNTGEVVWHFITGSVNPASMDYILENMSEMDRVRHYELLRQTNKAAARRFKEANGFFKVGVTLFSIIDGKRLDYYRKFYITFALHDLLFSKDGTTWPLEWEFLEHVKKSIPPNITPEPTVQIEDAMFGTSVSKELPEELFRGKAVPKSAAREEKRKKKQTMLKEKVAPY